MAILLDFKMVREDDRTVEYRFGFGDQELTRQLVIEKESLECWIPEPELDLDVERVYGQIMRQFRETEEWPRVGMYAA